MFFQVDVSKCWSANALNLNFSDIRNGKLKKTLYHNLTTFEITSPVVGCCQGTLRVCISGVQL